MNHKERQLRIKVFKKEFDRIKDEKKRALLTKELESLYAGESAYYEGRKDEVVSSGLFFMGIMIMSIIITILIIK